MDKPREVTRRRRIHFDEATLEDVLGEWHELGRDFLKEAATFVQERPLEALAAALLAGTVLGALLGRRQ